MEMKVVILGHTGFLGNALFKHFKEVGLSVEGYSSSTLDLTLPTSVDELCRILDEETILIIATRNKAEQEHSLQGLNKNILMNQHIAACLEKQSVKSCVFFSSDGVYGEPVTNLNRSEKDNVQPTNLYGTNSMVGETLLKIMSERSGAPLLIIRLCRVYGPGDLEISSYGPSQFITTMLKENKIRLFGKGEERRAYLYIDDLVKIVDQLVLNNICGTFNVGMGKSYSFQEIVEIIKKISKMNPEIKVIARNRNKVDLGFNIEKLVGVLPDLEFTDFEIGLKDTYDFISKKFSTPKP